MAWLYIEQTPTHTFIGEWNTAHWIVPCGVPPTACFQLGIFSPVSLEVVECDSLSMVASKLRWLEPGTDNAKFMSSVPNWPFKLSLRSCRVCVDNSVAVLVDINNPNLACCEQTRHSDLKVHTTNHEGTRTLNLLIRSQTPCPLGHVVCWRPPLFTHLRWSLVQPTAGFGLITWLVDIGWSLIEITACHRISPMYHALKHVVLPATCTLETPTELEYHLPMEVIKLTCPHLIVGKKSSVHWQKMLWEEIWHKAKPGVCLLMLGLIGENIKQRFVDAVCSATLWKWVIYPESSW